MSQGNLFGAPDTPEPTDRRPYQWGTAAAAAAGRWHGVGDAELRAALERASTFPDADLADVRAGAVIERRGMVFRRRPTEVEAADAARQTKLF